MKFHLVPVVFAFWIKGLPASAVPEFLQLHEAQGQARFLQGLTDVCGDCWCVPDEETPVCPDESPGITETFPKSVSDMYCSFVLTESIPLQAENGSACFPFADTLGPFGERYPESFRPQCEMPQSSDGVCAFVFEGGNDNFGTHEECIGRRYKMETFPTEADVPENAAITHLGPCGVCSSAQDLGVRMATRNTLESTSLACGTTYFATRASVEDAFGVLVKCYEKEGFTSECAELWSHFTAVNAEKCAVPCIGHEPPFNGEPPECFVTECIQCSKDDFSPTFDAIAGRTQENSGITENIGRNCSTFYRVDHDPCPGVDISSVNITVVKNDQNDPSSGSAQKYVVGVAFCTLQFLWVLLTS